MIRRSLRWLGLISCAAGLTSLGCSRQSTPPAATVAESSSESSRPVTPTEPNRATAVTDQPSESRPSVSDPKYHASFEDAVITEVDSADQDLPPDRTRTGKSTGELHDAVVEEWKKIPLQKPTGELIHYTALMETTFGNVLLELRPELAPNHVRNFIALSRAGYYDGLVFEKVLHQKPDTPDAEQLQLLEAGCPLGTGADRTAHLGYWMKPEFSTTVKHEEGTVGFWREAQPETAACRFYVTLSSAPAMDGHFTIFARVIDGLDVLRKISLQPKMPASDGREPDRPIDPVKITKMTIQMRE